MAQFAVCRGAFLGCWFIGGWGGDSCWSTVRFGSIRFASKAVRFLRLRPGSKLNLEPPKRFEPLVRYALGYLRAPLPIPAYSRSLDLACRVLIAIWKSFRSLMSTSEMTSLINRTIGNSVAVTCLSQKIQWLSGSQDIKKTRIRWHVWQIEFMFRVFPQDHFTYNFGSHRRQTYPCDKMDPIQYSGSSDFVVKPILGHSSWI